MKKNTSEKTGRYSYQIWLTIDHRDKLHAIVDSTGVNSAEFARNCIDSHFKKLKLRKRSNKKRKTIKY